MQVFLCHSSADKERVRELYHRLKADSFDPWLDTERILPGQDWDREIRRAIKSSGVVVICLSRDAVTKEGYVQKELKLALDVAAEKPEGTIFIVPVKFEECEVPDSLCRYQWVDCFQRDGFEKLRSALRVRIGQAKVTKGAESFHAPSPSSKPATSFSLKPHSGTKPTVTLTHYGDRVTYRVDGRIAGLVDGSINLHPAPFHCQLVVGRRGEWEAVLDDGDWANIILGSLEDVFPPSVPGMTSIQNWTPVGKVLVIRVGKMGEHVQVPDAGAVVELTVRVSPRGPEHIAPRQFQVVKDGDSVTVIEL